MAEKNPTVALRHPELGRTTSQPLSAARHLLNSGWQAADEKSAEQLGVEYSSDDQTSESAPQGKTAKELNEEAAKSKSATSKPSSSKSTSDGK